jgi:L-lactate dehydrogenase complex protein LldF
LRPTPADFSKNAAAALADAGLQEALSGLPAGLAAARERAKAALPEFEALRRTGRDIKDHTLANLDLYLEAFERNATAAGTQVHWAASAGDACEIIGKICRDADARLVAKGKSMVSEEINLAAYLQTSGLEVVETDLGEYLVQIRDELPSHVIAPAIHLGPADIEATFRARHHHLPRDRPLASPEALVAEARAVLRDTFLTADVGITGANFLVAATGSTLLVTNEGNGDLTQSLPKVHIVVASIEKVVPTLNDAFALLRLLARSATGQDCANYTTLVTGPRRAGDPDGPEVCHIVLVDNGRAELLGSEFRAALRCIRCGACMNVCPVYGAIGGHPYGSVYPGPIGAVFTPVLAGLPQAASLPQASTFCGRCEEVCPVEIPLVRLMRQWRKAALAQSEARRTRAALRIWAFFAARPWLYHRAARLVVALLGACGRRRGALRRWPLASGWTRHRDLPAPQGHTFQQLWARRQGRSTP